jgi:hypothetical protein
LAAFGGGSAAGFGLTAFGGLGGTASISFFLATISAANSDFR